MIDNFDLILPLLNFKDASHHVQILQRSKDGHDKSTRVVASWFVTSESQLKFLYPGIVALCEQYQARCYIMINSKSHEMFAWKLSDLLLTSIKSKSIQPITTIFRSHDLCNGKSKIWVVDVDNPEIDLDKLESKINSCRSGHFKNVIQRIPTKNGYHILTHPFDLSQIFLPDQVELRKNSSTLLYCS